MGKIIYLFINVNFQGLILVIFLLIIGPKARSYLLLLVRMKRLVVETVDGLISYRVL